ncbi:hypothetical protein BHE74_00055495 [Ensete ventricosum]|nr:hypothetical protein GW17_00053936 [Ensete ventricosum]RWW39199.1 hypothetical protein BHE74_00055495 [Ensete ventricosum]
MDHNCKKNVLGVCILDHGQRSARLAGTGRRGPSRAWDPRLPITIHLSHQPPATPVRYRNPDLRPERALSGPLSASVPLSSVDEGVSTVKDRGKDGAPAARSGDSCRSRKRIPRQPNELASDGRRRNDRERRRVKRGHSD